MSDYLIHWTDTGRNTDLHQSKPDADAIMSSTRVDSEAEVIGFLMSLPGDGSFVVRALTEMS